MAVLERRPSYRWPFYGGILLKNPKSRDPSGNLVTIIYLSYLGPLKSENGNFKKRKRKFVRTIANNLCMPIFRSNEQITFFYFLQIHPTYLYTVYGQFLGHLDLFKPKNIYF